MPAPFPAHFRLKKSADFARIYASKLSAADGLLLVFGLANGLPHSRVGLSVSRKHGGAVERNRWKRLFREAFRLTCTELPDGIDFILIPRGGATPELGPLRQSLVKLGRQVAKKVSRAAKPKPPSD